MNLPDEKREALAEGICSAICEGTAPAGIPGAENPRHRIAACYEHQQAADALAPLLAGWLAEAWDQGRRAERRDWEFTFDLATPDEERQPWPNPYRSES